MPISSAALVLTLAILTGTMKAPDASAKGESKMQASASDSALKASDREIIGAASEQIGIDAVVRQMLAQEDELTNQRMTWMFSLNGFLFAALGFAWDKRDARSLKLTVASLGVWVSSLILTSLYLASRSQRALLLWWHHNRPDSYRGPGVMGAEPIGSGLYLMYVPPWSWIALGLVIAWLIILASIYKNNGASEARSRGWISRALR